MEHELTCMLVRGIKLFFNKCPNYPLSMSKNFISGHLLNLVSKYI